MHKSFWEYEVGHDATRSKRYIEAKNLTEMLLRSPPCKIAKRLEEMGRARTANPWSDLGTFGLDEERLLSTHDPLVRLALARWGCDGGVLGTIFNEFDSGTPERLALFMNKRFFYEVDRLSWTRSLVGLVQSATSPERIAIASNPSVVHRLLAGTISDLVASLDDSKHQEKVLMDFLDGLPDNPMTTEDGFEFSEHAFRASVWRLAETLPAEGRWGMKLACLFQLFLLGKSGPFTRTAGIPEREILLAAIEKWAAVNDSSPQFHLSYQDEVVLLLSRAGLIAGKLKADDVERNPILAARCAFYREVRLDEDRAQRLSSEGLVQEALQAIYNSENWRTQDARNRLFEAADACWEANRGNADLEFNSIYKHWDKLEEIFRKQHPECFKDDEAAEAQFDAENVSSERENIARLEYGLQKIASDLNKMRIILSTILVLVGALALDRIF